MLVHIFMRQLMAAFHIRLFFLNDILKSRNNTSDFLSACHNQSLKTCHGWGEMKNKYEYIGQHA